MVGAVLMLGGLGLIVGIGLAVASKIFYVYVDPLILEIDDVLPGANCGGCGLPGCSANAEAIVAGKAPATPVLSTPTDSSRPRAFNSFCNRSSRIAATVSHQIKTEAYFDASFRQLDDDLSTAAFVDGAVKAIAAGASIYGGCCTVGPADISSLAATLESGSG